MVSPVIKQSWTVSALLLSSLNEGLVLTYPYSILPALEAQDSPIKVNLEIGSWIASCIGIAKIFGLFFTSILLDRLGRRLTHALILLPGIFGWLIIFFANNVPMIIIGRILGGFSTAPGFVIGVVVIGEYTSPKFRGLFINMKATSLCIGNLIMHILATFLHWRTVTLVCIVPLATAFCINCTWSESPAWLLSRNQFMKGERTFYNLRGTCEKSVAEFEAMIGAQKERNSMFCVYPRKGCAENFSKFIKKFTQNNFVKPLLIMLALFMLLEACGRHIFPVYALDIMSDVVKDKTQTLWFTIAIDIVAIVGGSFSCILVKMVKRRILLFVGGIISVIFLFSISLYLFLLSKGVLANHGPWILSTALIIYFIFASVGCITIPVVMLGEIFPLEHRETGTGAAAALSSAMITIALKVTPSIIASIKVHGTFTVLSIIMLLDLLFLYFVLPETKDKSLVEIEEILKHGKRTDNGKSNKENSSEVIQELDTKKEQQQSVGLLE